MHNIRLTCRANESMECFRSRTRHACRRGTLLVVLLLISCSENRATAVTLAEYTAAAPLKLFRATKGAEMPNSIDQTNNLAEGDKALLLSDKGLSDVIGISKLMVEDDGKPVPVRSIKNLHIFLNKNQISTIPDEISALDNVVFLYLEFNRLDDLPVALKDMDSLVGMYYTANRFTEIPPFVFQMTRLKKLQFSKNELTELPMEIGNLTELRHFNISGNRIAEIPESISKLTRLRVCDLSDNRIASLPESFGNVRIVNQLRVRNNPLSSLPIGFSEMRATIDVTGTKIDVASLPPPLRLKISTEKPPGSKIPENIIVRPPAKKK